MNKVFLASLLLIGVFLIGSSGVALAQCQDYECTMIEVQYGEVYDDHDEACVTLCPFYLAYPIYLYGGWFTGYLYPIDTKNFLGTADSMYDWAGCSVERRGRSIKAKLTYIQEDEGYVDILNCTPCDGCCPPL